MNQKNLKTLIIDTLEHYKALDRVDLDVRARKSLMDDMIICSGTSRRHVISMADQLVTTLKHNGFEVLGVEGKTEGNWVLIDVGDIVVHIMLPETRAFYDLETLWKKASTTSSTILLSTSTLAY